MPRPSRSSRWPGWVAVCCVSAPLLGCELLLGAPAAGVDAGTAITAPSAVNDAGTSASSSSGTVPRGDAGATVRDGGPQATADAGSPVFAAAPSMARRLSQAELDNVLRDVLGDDTRPASRILAEDVFTPYDNDYTTQSVSEALIASLETLAADVASRAMADTARRTLLLPCVPSGAADAACFRTTIQTLGRRLLRRTLTTAELDAYATLLTYATESNPQVVHGFHTSVELLLRVLLQSPELLYRIEVGTPGPQPAVFQLTQTEVATRLSFLLWGSTPDDELLNAAAAGTLATPAQVRAQAVRLMADPRARVQLQRFHAMWLGYRTMPHPAALVTSLRRETNALLDRVIFAEDQDYLNLFRSPETFVDAALATHYGLPAPPGTEGWVRYGDTGRGGILSHGSVLSAFNKFTDTSPTQRGILVLTRLMCGEVYSPPATVNADQPPGEGTAECKEARYREHTTTPSCASCHDQMDPLGFGLENYDMAGRYRSHDEGKPQCVIGGQGDMPGVGTFSGPRQLAERLMESGLLHRCLVRQFTSFSLGRPLKLEELVETEARANEWSAQGLHLKTLLLNLVSSPAFAQTRRDEVQP